jgi:hypothetical protein
MQKIMFNDHYSLERGTLNGVKTRTSRNEFGHKLNPDEKIFFNLINDDEYLKNNKVEFNGVDEFAIINDNHSYKFKTRYKVGEWVAIAQSYSQIVSYTGPLFDGMTLKNTPGWNNKMFVKASSMLRHIVIDSIKLERIQDISEEDCIKEGIHIETEPSNPSKHFYFFDSDEERYCFSNPKTAFKFLLSKLNGRKNELWENNEYVVVYYYHLVTKDELPF